MKPSSPEPAEAATFTDLDDAALVAASVEGHRDAFDVIVERHRRTVYQVCYRFVTNHEDASDLSQEAFVRAWRGLKNFKGQSALSTWLYRIAVNVCLNRVQARTPKAEAIESAEHFEDTRIEDARATLLREERAVAVRRAIAGLPKKQRATLDPADLSRDVASADRRRARQFGRRGEGQFLPRAREPEEAPGGRAMTHLTADELVDAVEGTLDAGRRAHLSACEACETEVRKLSAILREAREIDVPEPSPLFWRHFSARVHAAIQGETAPGGGWAPVAALARAGADCRAGGDHRGAHYVGAAAWERAGRAGTRAGGGVNTSRRREMSRRPTKAGSLWRTWWARWIGTRPTPPASSCSRAPLSGRPSS